VKCALERLAREAVDPTINLMPALIDAARADVTVGESMGALETVFGTWYERTVV
jgi:methylmalonyl-CoA mutase N-terminal domain/subunit